MLPVVMRRQRLWFWLFASAAGLIECWSYRFWIEPDGVNYLDVANAYLRHDWLAAINSYWSPLYSWLLALTFYVVRPSGYRESTVLHLLNFVIFLFALRCGEFFISELVNSRTEKSIPDWSIWTVGYSLLLFTSLFMNAAYLDTPDLCTSGLVYMAAGLLIRICSGGAALRVFAIFGAVLGIAYFSKTIMFLVAFAFLAAAGRRRGTTLAFACFVVIALPWIIILSRSVGHITYGDAGSMNYIGYVASSGSPVHPPRIIFTSPEVREFATPVRATYPPWYNAYWMEGLHPRFEWAAQFRVLVGTAKDYVHILSGQKEFIAGFLLLFLAWPRLQTIRWQVLVPAFWGFSLYALIHVESRLVGAFFVLLWLILYSGLCIRSDRLLKLVIFAIVLATVFKIVRAEVVRPLNSPHVQWQTAEAIHEMGIQPGMQVAVFGHTDRGDDYWAHLLGVRVVADIQMDAMPTYWSSPPGVRTEILSRLSDLDIRAVITTDPREDGWQMIPGTTFGVRLLKSSASHPKEFLNSQISNGDRKLESNCVPSASSGHCADQSVGDPWNFPQ